MYGNTCHTYVSKVEKLNNNIPRILQNKTLTSHVIHLYIAVLLSLLQFQYYGPILSVCHRVTEGCFCE